jgi:hypothetical protein
MSVFDSVLLNVFVFVFASRNFVFLVSVSACLLVQNGCIFRPPRA